jgi:hypothetical protein
MATIKSFTDISQSKTLSKILPLESADMGWNVFVDGTTRILPIDDWDLTKDGDGHVKFYHAWSLGALLGVLPNNENISTNLSKGGYRISTLEYTNNWFVDYEDETNGLNNCVTSADNPVDACYELILKLHELSLL